MSGITESDDSNGTAVVRGYVTIFQRTPDFPLQPVWANRYEDRCVREDGRWRPAHRRGFQPVPGDVSAHLPLNPPRATR